MVIFFVKFVCQFCGDSCIPFIPRIVFIGNSNGIATIDISGAYSGLTSYVGFVVKFFTWILVHSSQIVTYLPLLRGDTRVVSNFGGFHYAMNMLRSAAVSFMMRYHL